MQTQTTGRNTETPCLETDSFTHSPMRTRRNVTARVTAPIVSDIWCSSTELLKHGTAQPSNCSPARARTIATQTLSRTHTHMHAHTHTLARMRTHSRPHSCNNAHLSQAVCPLAHLRSEQARLDLNLRCFFSPGGGLAPQSGKALRLSAYAKQAQPAESVHPGTEVPPKSMLARSTPRFWDHMN